MGWQREEIKAYQATPDYIRFVDEARARLDHLKADGELSTFDGRVRIGKTRTYCARCRQECEYHLFAHPNRSLAPSERAIRAWCLDGQHGATQLVAVVLAYRLAKESNV
jgi:hypothetical protein